MNRLNKFFRKGAMVAFMLLLFSVVQAQHPQKVKKQAVKYQNLLALIDAFYVDTVNMEKITEDAIVKALADLDPHSVYISKKELKDMNEPLQGSFSGVGIQFNILRDTLMVVATIPGGPSEKVGVRAGDRIVKIDDGNVAGIGLKNSDVRKKLRGEKGSVVTVVIKRRNEKELLDFTIVRDKIPIHSLDAAYMLNKDVGYIKLNRFSATTTKEFNKAVVELKEKGMKKMVLDLRGNGGGYMSAAISVVDNLMDGGKLIVYTKGLAFPRRESKSTNSGLFKDGKVVVLIDEGSASASEIVTGAIQDWDRGVVIGTRSFGKGLVQRQFPLSDGTMVRLTTAHYYTPTGRCIQKAYDKGVKDYRLEVLKRYKSGEMISADSIKVVDSLKYNTLKNGRTVYGGGGIIPDVFMPLDTTKNYKYLNLLVRKNVVRPFIADYLDDNRESIRKQYPNFDSFNQHFMVTDKMMADLEKAGDKAGVKKNEKEYKTIEEELRTYIKAILASDLWSSKEYYQVSNKDNRYVKKALEILENPKEYDAKLQPEQK